MNELLDEFEILRKNNLQKLKGLNIKHHMLLLEATHPYLGTTNLQQLLSAWVVHDFGHIAQIARVMARQYADEVGPWKAYIGLLNK